MPTSKKKKITRKSSSSLSNKVIILLLICVAGYFLLTKVDILKIFGFNKQQKPFHTKISTAEIYDLAATKETDAQLVGPISYPGSSNHTFDYYLVKTIFVDQKPRYLTDCYISTHAISTSLSGCKDQFNKEWFIQLPTEVHPQ